MKNQLHYLAGITAALVLTFCQPARAALINVSTIYEPSILIPDYVPTGAGVSDTRSFSLSGVTSISSLEVSLNIAGDWNGDYYAYLRHGNAMAVLLNRVGKTAGDEYGYGDSGFHVTFSDSASNGDIHLYQGVSDPMGLSLGGRWQPDGRNADPDLVTDGSTRNNLLSQFTGQDLNGDWTLYVLDNSSLGQGTLVSWGLNITADAVAVPDSSTGLVGMVTLVGIAFLPRLLTGKKRAA